MVRAMPARQLWAFLTERDVRELIDQIGAREPGLAVSQGRYLRGEPQALLRDPRALERRDSLPGERRLYLLHAKYSADIVTHLQPAGPFAGWTPIDSPRRADLPKLREKTACIVIRLKQAPEGELEPARIYAHVTYWRAADKERKRPMFSIWASQTLKWMAARLPPTSAKMIRIGADALAQAKGGQVRLRYLYRTIQP